MKFRQIKSEEWQKGDYRVFAHINISSLDLAKKFGIEFEDYYEEGLGESKSAKFLTEGGMQFFIKEHAFTTVNQIYIGCLNNQETVASDLDEVLEILELGSKDVFFIYNDVKLIPDELWRQDDNGHKFLIETFRCRADAVKAMREFEARMHKQTYWIEKKK